MSRIQERQDLLTLSNFRENEEGNWDLMQGDQVVGTVTSQLPEAPVIPTLRENPFAPGNNTYEMNWGERNAMEEILKRGRRGDGTWNIGWVQGAMGNNITQAQMNDYAQIAGYQALSNEFDSQLESKGLQKVSFGEGRDSVLARLAYPQLVLDEQGRVNTEKQNLLTTVNEGIQGRNQYGDDRQDKADATDLETKRRAADQAFELKQLDRENQAKLDQYDRDLKKWEQSNRKDTIAALVAGLATLGAGFAM